MALRRKRKKPPYIHDKFETIETVKKRNRQLIKWLRKKKTPIATNLADQLEACADIEQPHCNSGACHMCMRKQRLRYFKELWPYISSVYANESMTIVPLTYVAPRGDLHTLDLIAFKRWIARGLRDVLPRNLGAVGGVDVSINSIVNVGFEWVVHAHVSVFKLSEGATAESVRSRIKERLNLPPTNTSLHIKEVNEGEEQKAASYCMKSIFNWRSTFWDDRDPCPRAHEWATRKNCPKRMDEVELRIWLARWTFADRLILVGITNPAAPNSIRLRNTPRTPKAPKTSERPLTAKARVTRGKRVKRGKPR